MNSDFEEVINTLVPHFEKLNLEFVIVGAQARDIISRQCNLKLSPRRTSDVDFGVLVTSWKDLDSLRESFSKDSKIRESTNKENKVRYYCLETPFDIVPFGKGIERNGKVSWPPFYDTIMTVMGYQEALDFAMSVKLQGREVKVVSPEMLTALKFVSWSKNRDRQKDAQDIGFILENYGYIDSDADLCIAIDYSNLLEFHNTDMDFAIASLIGIRIRSFVTQEHFLLIKKLLDDEELRMKLAREMVTSNVLNEEEKENRNFQILEALLYGLNRKK